MAYPKLTYIARSNTSVTVTYTSDTANQGMTYCQVYRCTSGGSTYDSTMQRIGIPGNKDGYSQTAYFDGLSKGTTYYFIAYGYATWGAMGWGDILSVTTTSTITTPSAPTIIYTSQGSNDNYLYASIDSQSDCSEEIQISIAGGAWQSFGSSIYLGTISSYAPSSYCKFRARYYNGLYSNWTESGYKYVSPSPPYCSLYGPDSSGVVTSGVGGYDFTTPGGSLISMTPGVDVKAGAADWIGGTNYDTDNLAGGQSVQFRARFNNNGFLSPGHDSTWGWTYSSTYTKPSKPNPPTINTSYDSNYIYASVSTSSGCTSTLEVAYGTGSYSSCNGTVYLSNVSAYERSFCRFRASQTQSGVTSDYAYSNFFEVCPTPPSCTLIGPDANGIVTVSTGGYIYIGPYGAQISMTPSTYMSVNGQSYQSGSSYDVDNLTARGTITFRAKYNNSGFITPNNDSWWGWAYSSTYEKILDPPQSISTTNDGNNIYCSTYPSAPSGYYIEYQIAYGASSTFSTVSGSSISSSAVNAYAPRSFCRIRARYVSSSNSSIYTDWKLSDSFIYVAPTPSSCSIIGPDASGNISPVPGNATFIDPYGTTSYLSMSTEIKVGTGSWTACGSYNIKSVAGGTVIYYRARVNPTDNTSFVCPASSSNWGWVTSASYTTPIVQPPTLKFKSSKTDSAIINIEWDNTADSVELRVYRQSDDDMVPAMTLAKGTLSKEVTGLIPFTYYYAYAWSVKNNVASATNSANLLFYTRPSNFSGFNFTARQAMSSPIRNGGNVVVMSKTTWNSFKVKINEFKTWKAQTASSYSFACANVAKGDKLTATRYNDLVAAVNSFGFSLPTVTGSVTKIGASNFTTLQSTLNSL